MKKLFRSQIAPFGDFEAQVRHVGEQLRHHREQLQKVEETKDLPVEQRYQAFSRPHVHPLIEASLDENFNPAYEIVDDPAPIVIELPKPTLRQQKDRLLQQVSEAEVRASDKILPPRGKRRMYHHRQEEIRAKDAERTRTEVKSILQRLTASLGFRSGDAESEALKSRTAEDHKFMQQCENMTTKTIELHRLASQAMHDIEDLTEADIATWEMPEGLR